MTDLTLTVEKLIPAPAERLYDAWLDPKMLQKFMTSGPGMSVPSAESDPRVGGSNRTVMSDGKTDMPHSGTYPVLNPHSRIVFTWVSPFSVNGSTVTLDLAPEAAGARLKLTHVRFASEEARHSHAGGWTAILDKQSKVMA